jgi:hypothetical protein
MINSKLGPPDRAAFFRGTSMAVLAWLVGWAWVSFSAVNFDQESSSDI